MWLLPSRWSRDNSDPRHVTESRVRVVPEKEARVPSPGWGRINVEQVNRPDVP